MNKLILLAFILLVTQIDSFYDSTAWAEQAIRVGVYDNKPIVFADRDGDVKGLFIDIIQHIAQEENWKIKYVHGTWPEGLERLDNGEIDLLAGIAYSKKRAQKYDFTFETVITNWAQVYKYPGSKIESLPDLESHKIAVVRNSIYHLFLRKLLRDFGIRCRLIEAEDYQTVFELIENKIVEAGVVNRLYGIQHEGNYPVIKTPIIFSPAEIRLAALKNKLPLVINKLDSHLAKLKKEDNSVYHKSLSDWLVGSPERAFPQWLKWVLVPVAGLIALFLSISLLLKAKVRARTSELYKKNRQLKQEIAERKRAEEELKTSAEIVRAIPSGLFIYQFEPPDRLILLHGNSEAEELTGIQLSEWHGREFNEIWPRAQAAGVTDAFLSVLKTGKIFETEDLYYKDNRMEGAFKLRVFPMPKKRLGVVFESILERKRAEEMLDRFFNLTPDMFFIADFTGELQHVNPAFKKILGYDREELIAKSCFDFVHPDDKASTLQAAEKLIQGESMLNFENRIVCNNGDYRWLQWTSLPDFEKEVVYGIARDVTEQKEAEYDRKKLESQLRQAQKMEAIGTLAGGIAHDFNNILGAVIGYTEITLSQHPQQHSITRNLQEVLTAGHRARDLVKQILTFSRQAEQQLQPVQVRLIAKEAVKLLRASLPTTIEIRWRIESDKTVLADPTQVHQIIMNLCTNAGYAMREKGGILKLRLVDMLLDGELAAEFPGLSPGQYMRLTVGDTGRGIPAEIREKIFDPFFTTKAKGEGTGMGLSVVHGIVKSHGGTITVSSGPEQGSTFQVYLPVIKGGAEHRIRAAESLPGGSERVLFVDDEKPLVDLSQRMLEGIGYRVTTRTSSIEALELFLAKPDRFDLVITDMTMPNMTGKELAAEILRVRPDMPLILCTGYSEIITEERAKALGIRAFLMKPIVLRDLSETIRNVLDESSAKSSIQMAAADSEVQDRQFDTP